ncbi:MAG: RecQ family ATP-dependent DNA helicase [Chlorobiota bacterium]
MQSYSEAELQRVLQTVFGFSDFRPGQLEIIRSVLAGHDTLVVMPTGAGKSLCYQLPALVLPGMALVISPLIALMEDQVQALQRRNISATCLHSGLQEGYVWHRLEGAASGAYRLLYVAPERLQQKSFISRLRQCRLSFVAVDEAHCISEWGHDFRPAYLEIAPALRQLGSPPVLALTATATPEVLRDIEELLQLRSPRRFIGGFDRPNLVWWVEESKDKRERLVQFCADRRDRPVLVYAASRRRVEQLCRHLQAQGLRAAAYHAGLDPDARQRIQREFLARNLPLLVATSAFGLGIDKPDIRAVIHYDPPLTLEAYYQEAGRAGRDGEPAECFLLYDPRDCAVQHQLLAAAHPEWETVVQVYRALISLAAGGTVVAMTPVEVANVLRLPESTVEAVVRLLERSGVLSSAVPEGELMVRFQASPEELREYWERSTVPERRRVLEALLRSAGAEAYHRPVTLSVPELLYRNGMAMEELERGLRALHYARLVHYEAATMRTGMQLLQPLPELPPVSPEYLKERRQRAWRKFYEVLEYATTPACKRLFLLRYFHDSSLTEPCGRCSSCQQRPSKRSKLVAMLRRGMKTAVRWRVEQPSELSAQHEAIIAEVRRGADIPALCHRMGLAPGTVARLLQEVIERGVELPREQLVPDERFYRAVQHAVARLGAAPLRDIAAALGGVQDYALLRVAVAFARRELLTSGGSSAG